MKIKIKKGKNGTLIGGFSKEGKVILINKKYLPDIQEGEEYICEPVEKDRFIIATSLQKIYYGCLDNDRNGDIYFESNGKKFPVQATLVDEKMGFNGEYLYKIKKYKITLPENFIVPNQKEYYEIIQNIVDFSSCRSLEEFETLFSKHASFEELDAYSKEVYKITVERFKRIEEKEEIEKKGIQEFWNGGWKAVLDNIKAMQEWLEQEEEIEKKLQVLYELVNKKEQEITEILKKYKVVNEDSWSTQLYIRLEDNRGVLIDYRKGEIVKGFFRFETITERYESEDGMRGGQVTYTKPVFYQDETAAWEIPGDILNLLNLFKEKTKYETEKEEVKMKKTKPPVSDDFTDRMFTIAASIIRQEKEYPVSEEIPDQDFIELCEKIKNK